MGVDPYGFEEDAPEPGAPDRSSGGVTLAVVLLSSLSALCCAGLDAAIMATGSNETGLDFLGVAHVLSLPVWIFGGIAIVSVAVHLGVRRWWANVGPNVVVGGGCGCVLWGLVFLGFAILSASSVR